MSSTNQVIREIRPSLYQVAPQTFWFSLGFGIFNLLIGIAMYNLVILYTLKLVGAIPLKMWAVIFIVQGAIMLVSLAINNWKLTRFMHTTGILVKTAWWLELFTAILTGYSPVLIIVWSLLLFLQIVIWIYFTPKVERV